MGRKVYLVSACRTPIGKFGGELSLISAVDLGALSIREVIHRAGIQPQDVDHVYMGCVIQAGLGQNVARQCAIKAGLPYEVTAETLNVVCGSGLDSVSQAARMIRSGDADIVIAGGTENMSQAPFAMMQGRFGYRMGNPMVRSDLVDTMVKDALWDAINDYHMGVTAENIATRWGITRQEQDVFAADSQMKACRAIARGDFVQEIVPVSVQHRKAVTVIERDESPRPETTVEALTKLKPAFVKDGTVTAGNASTINDGAAAVVLASEEKVCELRLTPIAEWMGSALGGVDPAYMGIGPVAATKRLLNKLNLSIQDIDLVESNEAFAVQSIAVARELQIPPEKLNVNGGAIALGHPVGASGCRILVTLLYAMRKRNAKFGIATLCVGGGMGCSALVKLV